MADLHETWGHVVATLSGFSLSTLVMLCITALVAGIARGFSGFGAALIFVPLASAAIGPKVASPILLLIDIVCAVTLLPDALRKADKRDVGAMSVGSLFAVPAGVALLVFVDQLIVRWVISLTALAFLMLLVSGWRYRGAVTMPLSVAVGVVAGVFSGTAQLGGPPVVAYWLGGERPASIVRANIIVYFAVLSVLSGISYLVAGLLDAEVFLLSFICGPIYGGGLYVGARCFHLASERTFRYACYVLIGLASVLGLPLLDGLR